MILDDERGGAGAAAGARQAPGMRRGDGQIFRRGLDRSAVRFPLPEVGIDQVAATPERPGRERSQAAEMLRRLRAQ